MLGRIRACPQKIIANTFVKQQGVAADVADLFAPLKDPIGAEFASVNPERSTGRFDETDNYIGERALSRARWSH